VPHDLLAELYSYYHYEVLFVVVPFPPVSPSSLFPGFYQKEVAKATNVTAQRQHAEGGSFQTLLYDERQRYSFVEYLCL
jgi:hypothetical protein